MDEETTLPPALVPHVKTIQAVTFTILLAFAAVTAFVLWFGIDETTKGALIGTWNNLAVAAATFWLGSSLGGKTKK